MGVSSNGVYVVGNAAGKSSGVISKTYPDIGARVVVIASLNDLGTVLF
jgi:hypothetical protein